MRTKSTLYSNELDNKKIFLSASFPQRERSEKYFKTAYPLEITDAVIAVVRATFGRMGKLVFGGHPTISPLILSVGEEFLPFIKEEYLPIVYMYQSKFFETIASEYTQRLIDKRIGKIIWVETIGSDRNKSLFAMRKIMLEESNPVAAIFIGGMEGIEEEFGLFTSLFKNRPVYCMGSTGGASRLLAQKIVKNEISLSSEYKKITKEELLTSNIYPTLVNAIFSDLFLRTDYDIKV